MKKIFSRTTQIAGVCFTIIALLSLYSMTSGYNTAFYALMLVCYCGLAYAMFAKKRDLIIAGSCGGIAVILFILCIRSIILQSRYGYSFSQYALSFFSDLLIVLSFAGLALVAYAATTDKLEDHLEALSRFWYAPAALRALALLLALCAYANNTYTYFLQGLSIFLGGFIAVVAVLFTSVWLLFPDRLPEPEPDNSPEGYIKMVKHILLLLFTFGIWWFIWIYRTTKFLNLANNEEPRKPVPELLLCMFIPFYLVFWNYKSALRIDYLLEQNGMGPKISNVCIFWSIFVPFMAPVLMQDSINHVALEFHRAYAELPESFYLYDIGETKSTL